MVICLLVFSLGMSLVLRQQGLWPSFNGRHVGQAFDGMGHPLSDCYVFYGYRGEQSGTLMSSYSLENGAATHTTDSSGRFEIPPKIYFRNFWFQKPVKAMGWVYSPQLHQVFIGSLEDSHPKIVLEDVSNNPDRWFDSLVAMSNIASWFSYGVMGNSPTLRVAPEIRQGFTTAFAQEIAQFNDKYIRTNATFLGGSMPGKNISIPVWREQFPQYANMAQQFLTDGKQGAPTDSVKQESSKRALTPLHTVVTNGSVDQVRAQLGQNVDVNAQDASGSTPLHCAAQLGRLDVVDLLVSHGANINAMDDYGRTPLHMAVRTRNLDLIQDLIAHGANINAADHSGQTPLLVAEQIQNNEKVIQFLQHSGAK